MKSRDAAPAAKTSGRRFIAFGLAIAALIGILFAVAAAFREFSNSEFFAFRKVEIYGVQRASREDIESIVKTNASNTGVWNADLMQIKQKVEKLPFVKNASVGRRLPDAIVVTIEERKPEALVNIRGQNFLVDRDGNLLAPSNKPEPDLPFAIIGWNEEKSVNAINENIERVKLYQKMLTELRDRQLSDKVKQVDIKSLREPRAIIEDSGYQVSIAIGREKFADNLSNGIRAIVGKGDKFAGVNFSGPNMMLVPREDLITKLQ